jgi:hypothetical protein
MICRPRVFALAVGALMATLAGGFVPTSSGGSSLTSAQVSAASRRMIVRFYYDDASHSDRVGTGVFRCDGRATLTGRSTPYFLIVADEPCCGPDVC